MRPNMYAVYNDRFVKEKDGLHNEQRSTAEFVCNESGRLQKGLVQVMLSAIKSCCK